jgi:hypothetical protein
MQSSLSSWENLSKRRCLHHLLQPVKENNWGHTLTQIWSICTLKTQSNCAPSNNQQILVTAVNTLWKTHTHTHKAYCYKINCAKKSKSEDEKKVHYHACVVML